MLHVCTRFRQVAHTKRDIVVVGYTSGDVFRQRRMVFLAGREAFPRPINLFHRSYNPVRRHPVSNLGPPWNNIPNIFEREGFWLWSFRFQSKV